MTVTWPEQRCDYVFSQQISAGSSSRSAEYLPLVSVIVPAYNAEAFIAKTLAAVLAQSHRHLEVWVVDDGSSDRTPNIVKAMAQADPRLNLLQQPNAGVAIARNAGLKRAKGEFVAPIDADDLWHCDTLKKMLLLFDKGGAQLGVVYAWSTDIDEQDLSTGGFHAATVKGDVYRTLICHNFLGNASSTLIRKDCLDKIGGYNAQFRDQNAQGCEDWDLYLRLAERYEFGVVPEFLVGYRKISGTMSGDFSQMARSQQVMLQAIEQAHPEIPGFLHRLSRSSFYLYLAQQSHAQGSPEDTLSWLRQAITVDPITPLCRPGLYVLLVKSWLRQFTRHSAFAQPAKSVVDSDTSASTSPPMPNDLAPTVPIKINRLKIWLKLLVGTVLHLSLSRI